MSQTTTPAAPTTDPRSLPLCDPANPDHVHARAWNVAACTCGLPMGVPFTPQSADASTDRARFVAGVSVSPEATSAVSLATVVAMADEENGRQRRGKRHGCTPIVRENGTPGWSCDGKASACPTPAPDEPDYAPAPAPVAGQTGRAMVNRARVLAPVVLSQSTGDGAGAWPYLTDYLTGTAAMGRLTYVLNTMAADEGLKYTRDLSRAYSSGADIDDILSDATERAHAALSSVLTRDDIMPGAGTGHHAHAWYVPRESACGACWDCTTRVRTWRGDDGAKMTCIGRRPGRSAWLTDGCSAPVTTLDYVTPARIVGRAIRAAIREAIRPARAVATDVPDLIGAAGATDPHADASPLDKYPTRARAVLLAACAAVESAGQDYAAGNGLPTDALRSAVALALGLAPSGRGKRDAMAMLRTMGATL